MSPDQGGILAFIEARHPDNNYGVDVVVNMLVSYDRRSEGLPEAVTDTVSVIVKIAGKSIMTTFRAVHQIVE